MRALGLVALGVPKPPPYNETCQPEHDRHDTKADVPAALPKLRNREGRAAEQAQPSTKSVDLNIKERPYDQCYSAQRRGCWSCTAQGMSATKGVNRTDDLLNDSVCDHASRDEPASHRNQPPRSTCQLPANRRSNPEQPSRVDQPTPEPGDGKPLSLGDHELQLGRPLCGQVAA